MKKYNRRQFLGLTTAGLALAGCGKSKELEQTVEENKAIVRHLLEQMDEGNPAMYDLLAKDYVVHWPGGIDVHGPQGVKESVTEYYAAFPDLKHIIHDIIAEGDKVAVRYTDRGTHKGEFMGISPTGKQISWSIISVFRLADGKLVEGWIGVDMLSLMQQLGAYK